jgi:hypothetical protein
MLCAVICPVLIDTILVKIYVSIPACPVTFHDRSPPQEGYGCENLVSDIEGRTQTAAFKNRVPEETTLTEAGRNSRFEKIT